MMGTSDPRADSLIEDFDCAICGRHVDNRWPPQAASVSLRPICRCCELHYGRDPGSAGTIRDRRIARQVSALEEALGTTAYLADWEARNGGMQR
ncbi:hypothetical protein ACXKGW_28615 [Klebsiella pneumoniae subsp. pneumoniae]